MFLLANKTNLDQSWAQDSVGELLYPGMKVGILPLSEDEGWASDAMAYRDRFSSDTEYLEDLRRPFHAYGIPSSALTMLDFHDGLIGGVSDFDALCLIGDDPDACMNAIFDQGLEEIVRNYQGLVIGISAGAEILCDSFFPLLEEESYEFHTGLDLFHGVDIMTHYEEDAWHLGAIIRRLEDAGRPQIILPENGAVILDGDHFDLLGDAFVADVPDLNEIYSLYQSMIG